MKDVLLTKRGLHLGMLIIRSNILQALQRVLSILLLPVVNVWYYAIISLLDYFIEIERGHELPSRFIIEDRHFFSDRLLLLLRLLLLQFVFCCCCPCLPMVSDRGCRQLFFQWLRIEELHWSMRCLLLVWRILRRWTIVYDNVITTHNTNPTTTNNNCLSRCSGAQYWCARNQSFVEWFFATFELVSALLTRNRSKTFRSSTYNLLAINRVAACVLI